MNRLVGMIHDSFQECGVRVTLEQIQRFVEKVEAENRGEKSSNESLLMLKWFSKEKRPHHGHTE